MTSDRDLQGGGYYAPTPEYDFDLQKVSKGTPGGELLRRYWHPVGLVSELTDKPVKVRVLGEDLILYKDHQGSVGLLAENCCHRGTSLYYGKIEEDGIRCCYHSWKFNERGECLSMPCEPGEERFKTRVKQPWYPTKQYHGMVFAYMGPLDKIPAFPKWDVLENIPEGYEIYADNKSSGMGGPVIGKGNWVQYFDNMMDPYHVFCLHMGISVEQFQNELSILPKVTWESDGDDSMYTHQDRPLENGKVFRRVSQIFFPSIRVIAPVDPDNAGFGKGGFVGFYVPVDDTHTRLFGFWPIKKGEKIGLADYQGKQWQELTEEEHRDMPGDYEAIHSIGNFSAYNREHLGYTDQGVTKLRSGLRKQISLVESGADPVRTHCGKEEVFVETKTGNYILDPQ